jgi:hypothetical protein
MILRIKSDDIEELRKALSSAHLEVIRELGHSRGIGSDPVGIECCRRKWKLEGLLRQLEGPGEPAPVLQIVRRRNRMDCEKAAA